MDRREFTLGTACFLAAAALPLPTAWAQRKPPQEGTDYLALDKRVPVEAPAGKVEVIEFFWYSCPHCFAFEPKLEAWIKRQPADVHVRRVPAAFRDSMVPQQRLFYALESMGKLDELHQKIFNAIHIDKQSLDTGEAIAAWVEKQGVDRARFTEAYNSFAVQNKARRAAQVQDAFKVQGVPAIGVSGRWYTDAGVAGNMDRALQVTDYLLAEARKQR